MKLFVLILIVLFQSMLHAAVETDTHTYIVSFKDGLIVINEQTGEENVLGHIKYPQSIDIHEHYGYVLGIYNIFVIDLKTHTVVKELPVTDPISLVIHVGVGYVLTKYSLCVIDLQKHSVETRWTVPKENRAMLIYGENLYILRDTFNEVLKVNILTSFTLERIRVGDRPIDIVRYKDRAYVINSQSDSISVIDLSRGEVVNTIKVGKLPTSMTIHRGLGYVTNRRSDSVTIIDLEKHDCVKTISFKQPPVDIKIEGGFGYVRLGLGEEISVFDLKDKEVLGEFANPGGVPIDFSDTHMYVGAKKKSLIPSEHHIQCKMANGTLTDYVVLNPEAFNVGCVSKRAQVYTSSPFEFMGSEFFYQLFFNDHLSLKMDPMDILSMLLSFQSPVAFLKTHVGQEVRKRLHLRLFQEVWLGHTEKAQRMVKYFLQLGDPVIKNLVAFAQSELGLFIFSEPMLTGDLLNADSEDAFKRFELLLKAKDLKAARAHFEIALFHCHPKACAYAAYLYLTQRVEDPGKLWSDYFDMADKNYFSALFKKSR